MGAWPPLHWSLIEQELFAHPKRPLLTANTTLLLRHLRIMSDLEVLIAFCYKLAVLAAART